MSRYTQFAVPAAVSLAVGLAGTILAPVSAQAQMGPSYEGGNCPPGVTCTHWCPGDPAIPGSQVVSWDWNICHDWYWTSEGIIDVTSNIVYPWQGTPHQATPPPVPAGPPPPPAPRPPHCPPFNVIIGPSECGGL